MRKIKEFSLTYKPQFVLPGTDSLIRFGNAKPRFAIISTNSSSVFPLPKQLICNIFN